MKTDRQMDRKTDQTKWEPPSTLKFFFTHKYISFNSFCTIIPFLVFSSYVFPQVLCHLSSLGTTDNCDPQPCGWKQGIRTKLPFSLLVSCIDVEAVCSCTLGLFLLQVQLITVSISSNLSIYVFL